MFYRFGHQLTRVDRDLIVLSGGFGCSYVRHSRLKDAILINIAQGDFEILLQGVPNRFCSIFVAALEELYLNCSYP